MKCICVCWSGCGEGGGEAGDVAADCDTSQRLLYGSVLAGAECRRRGATHGHCGGRGGG